MSPRTEHVGESPVRPDGHDKVTGHARYTDDIKMPGMLHGATLRSPHARARVRALRFDADRAPAGATVVLPGDIPGAHGIQLIDDAWPALAGDEVRHVGEPLAVVAAADRAAAHAALDAFRVDYEPLDPVLGWDDALREPPFDEIHLSCGDAELALADAPHVIEHTYTTGYQEHIYIECQAMIAWFEDDGTLTVLGSMQCPYYVHKSLMHTMDLPADKVRVKAAAVGGGFGGKEDFPSVIAVHAALLARASGRPVKIVYDRHEDIVATTKRHPSRIRHRTGFDDAGRLLAMDIDILLDGGAYRTLSPVVLSRGVLHASGPYRCPNVRVRGRVLRTNTAPNAAFRGFGAPQVLFAVERQMDAVARAAGVDPLTLRERNVLEPGDTLPTGQVMHEAASARLCLETVEEHTNFRARWEELEAARGARADGDPLRGLGLSLFFHGAGFTGRGEHRMRSPVTVRLLDDGRIQVLTVQTDIGQGSSITLPLIAAEAGGVGLDDLSFPPPDTGLAPDSGPTVASRTTMVVGSTIVRAVAQLRDQVLRGIAARIGEDPDDLTVSDGEVHGPPGRVGRFRDLARQHVAEHGPLEITVHHEPPEWQQFDDATYQGTAYATYGWGADVVEVELDPDTLEVHPVHATVACEIGKAIHPSLVRGQLEGGTLQALAWGYLEEIQLDKGRYRNDRLQTYIIPTIQDTPSMDIHILERPWEGGAFGAKGLGELPMDGGAPALVQAIENATGIVPDEIPATPERLVQWREQGRTVDGDGGRR